MAALAGLSKLRLVFARLHTQSPASLDDLDIGGGSAARLCELPALNWRSPYDHPEQRRKPSDSVSDPDLAKFGISFGLEG